MIRIISFLLVFTVPNLLEAHDDGGESKRFEKVVEVLKAYNVEFEKNAETVQSLKKSLTEIRRLGDKNDARLEELNGLENELEGVRDLVTAVQSQLKDMKELLPSSQVNEEKFILAVTRLEDRIAKLEAEKSKVTDSVEKLQENTDKLKFNTDIRVTYNPRVPGRPRAFYDVIVVDITNGPRAIPGAQVEVIWEVNGSKSPPVKFNADKSGLIRVPKPDIKNAMLPPSIQFDYLGDEAHHSTSLQMRIK